MLRHNFLMLKMNHSLLAFLNVASGSQIAASPFSLTILGTMTSHSGKVKSLKIRKDKMSTIIALDASMTNFHQKSSQALKNKSKSMSKRSILIMQAQGRIKAHKPSRYSTSRESLTKNKISKSRNTLATIVIKCVQIQWMMQVWQIEIKCSVRKTLCKLEALMISRMNKSFR